MGKHNQGSRRIYCVGGLSNVSNWMQGVNVYRMEDADIVVFPGGPDVNPEVYGEKKHPFTSFYDELDKKDINEFNRAVRLGKRMVGICRGAQLLCAKAGGKLVQHQQDAEAHHAIFTYDGHRVVTSSSHHQAMFPWRMSWNDFKVLAWSIGLSVRHEGGDMAEMVIGNAPMNMEVEAAYFPKIRALCIQGHPEWQFPSCNAIEEHGTAIDFYRKTLDLFMRNHDFKEAQDAYSLCI